MVSLARSSIVFWLSNSMLKGYLLAFIVHFLHLSRPNSIFTSREKLWTVWISWLSFWSDSAYRPSFRSSINNRWLIFLLFFVLPLLKSYPILCSFSILQSGSKMRQERSGERLSPWNIPRWIFTFGIIIWPFV